MSKKKKKTIILITIIALLILGLIGSALYFKYKKTKNNVDTTTKSQNPNEVSKSTYPTSGSSNNSGSGGSSKNGGGPSTPTGQLLNKHSISLSSTAIESNPDMNSICQSTPGSSCDLKLSGPDNSIKYVGSKNIDASGAANFYWNARNIGLTSGRWKIEAIAVLNDKSATSTPDYLQVNP